jgi:hypothetical protein
MELCGAKHSGSGRRVFGGGTAGESVYGAASVPVGHHFRLDEQAGNNGMPHGHSIDSERMEGQPQSLGVRPFRGDKERGKEPDII